MDLATAPLKEEDLRHWRLIESFRQRLGEVSGAGIEGSTWADPKRKLQLAEYLSLFLFALMNPMLATARAVCGASDLQRVRQELCRRHVSLGSFSEAQNLVEPEWLESLFTQLSKQIGEPSPKSPHEAWQEWFARDGSLLSALPRMHWALFGGGRAKKSGGANNAVRLHLSFHLLDDKPVRAQVTPGKNCERKSWKEQWVRGDVYVGDRYYAENYQLLKELEAHGCGYVVRLCDAAVVTVLEELSVNSADQAAGVTRHAMVQLGRRPEDQIGPVRVIWVQSATAGELRLVTCLPMASAPAELISVMYRRRWQIEGFFKWFKCLLNCRHWLAESQHGVTVQLYLALIAAVLLQLVTGRRPTKRMMELIGLYQIGWATLEELVNGLQREEKRNVAHLKTSQ